MPNVIDLFCGAGGLSEGFRQAGFDILLGVDFNEHAINTHHYNFKNSISVCADLTKVDPEELLNQHSIHKKDIDGIIGGFPCQGFSMAGKRWIEDPRNKLFLEVVKFVEHIQPSFFLLENVPGLLSMKNGSIKDEIIGAFSELGYNVEAKVLTATDYGVAQIRKRVFFFGLKKGNPSFPEPTVISPIPLWEVIGDLPKLELGEGGEELILEDGEVIYNHFAFPLQDLNKKRLQNIPEGGNHSDLPKELQRKTAYNSAYRRLHRNKPSYTIHTHFRDEYLIHPTQDRVISVREAARIQSFPDEFKFIGPRSRKGQMGQVGNAVPPLLAKHIALEVLKYL